MTSSFSHIFVKRGQVAEAGQSSGESAGRPRSDGDPVRAAAEAPLRSPDVVVKEEPWPWPPGEKKTIGGIYELRGDLGKGGMGYVYLADDTATHRRVAVKVPARSFVDRPGARKRLTHEVEEWRRLCHPNIVQAIDLWDDQSTDYLPAIVMEFCDGGSLAEQMRQLSLAQKLDVLIQVCWGMEYAHGLGVIHRDLKPANVLMMKDGRAFVSDFGLVKNLGPDALPEGGLGQGKALSIDVSSGFGTPAYMPPEQWDGTPGRASDIYAFGVMMYEVLCGRRPFDGNPAELYRLHVEGKVPDPRDMGLSVNGELPDMMLRCLSTKAEERPRAFGEVAEVLEKAFRQVPGGSYVEVRKKPGGLELSREAKVEHGWALLRLGVGCMRRGDMQDALRQFKEAEAIFKEVGDRAGLAASPGNQALILRGWGRLDEAIKLHKEQEQICRDLGDRAGLQASLGNQALILRAWGRLDEAMKLHKEEEQICRELGHRAGLSRSLGDQALILRDWGRLDQAMKLHKEGEQICRELGDRAGLGAILGNQALILKAWGRLDEAMKLLKQQEQICRELGDRAGLGASLGNQALILQDWGRLDEAMKLHKEEEQICWELGDRAGLSTSLGNQALILKAWGRLDEAIELHKEQEHICRELGDRAGLSTSLCNQAAILKAWGRLDEAMKLYKEEEQICRQLGLAEGLALSLANQASILGLKLGRPLEALQLAEEAHRIAASAGLAGLAGQIEKIKQRISAVYGH